MVFAQLLGIFVFAMVQLPDVTKYMSARPPAETKDYIMQQTMLRVKDPIRSLDFYTNVLGMKLLMHRDFAQWGFSVYFVAPSDAPFEPDETARWQRCMMTPGCIELTWNHGSETDAAMRVYNTGNICRRGGSLQYGGTDGVSSEGNRRCSST